MDPSSPLVARVVPDVTGLDKQFDYLVPDAMRSRVRCRLDGARLVARTARRRLDRVAGRSGRIRGGRPAHTVGEVVGYRTLGGPHRPRSLGVDAMGRRSAASVHGGSQPSWHGGHSCRCRSTALREHSIDSPLPRLIRLAAVRRSSSRCVVEALARGPALVIHPAVDEARRLGARLRQSGYSVAVHPDQWARAAAGVDVVIGGRSAVWAPCAGMRSIVVLDEHDEALQEERSPTWHARDVAIERAARAGVPCALVSPCPSATALLWAARFVPAQLGCRRARRLADPRTGRPLAGGAVEALLADVAADPAPAQRRPARHLRAQHQGPGTAAGVSHLQVAATVREVPGSSRPGRHRIARVPPLRHDASRRLPALRFRGAVLAAAGSEPSAEEIEAAAGRPVGMVTGDTRIAARLRRVDRHGSGAAPRRPSRRRGVPRPRRRAVGTQVPGRRAGHGAAGASRTAGGATQRGRASVGADVPAASRGAAGGVARRPVARLPRPS